jgi:hypothetical protein
MPTRVHLHNFRFSVYIDADGTVTLTDLPPELREVVVALDPTHQWDPSCAAPPPQSPAPLGDDRSPRQATPEALE